MESAPEGTGSGSYDSKSPVTANAEQHLSIAEDDLVLSRLGKKPVLKV